MVLSYLKALQKETIILFVSLTVSILVVFFSIDYWEKVKVEKTEAYQRLDDSKQKHAFSMSRKSMLEEYKLRYEKLEFKNIAGDENRLDWINALELIAKNEGIPYINYKIDKQIKYLDQNIESNYPDVDSYKSVMILDMKIVHEGDLYIVFKALKEKAKGLFDISSCDIKRIGFNGSSILENKTGLNFSANCTLNWYSFQPRSS